MQSSLDQVKRRPALLLLIVLAHLGAAWLLERQRMPWPNKPSVASSIEIRLLPNVRRRPVPTQVIQPIWVPPISDTVPLPPVPAIKQIQAIADARTASLPAAPASAASAPLRLNLPLNMLAQPTLLDQIHADPRSHSPRATLENRIADATGTLPITTEGATDGTDSKLVRQGSKCVRVTQARIATLNPMDERARSQPAVSGECFH